MWSLYYEVAPEIQVNLIALLIQRLIKLTTVIIKESVMRTLTRKKYDATFVHGSIRANFV
jgi:hypothetical protein